MERHDWPTLLAHYNHVLLERIHRGNPIESLTLA